jgi:hypothetical protein
MIGSRSMYIVAISSFLLGFGLGGLSLHMVSAQGVTGIQASVTQIGTSLVEMQKNVDALQKNMNTIKQAKDQLSSLSDTGGTINKLVPQY